MKIIISSILASSLVASLNAQTLEERLSSLEMFTSVQVGFTHLNTTKKDTAGTVTLAEEQDSSSENVKLELGYAYNENIELSVNYQRIDNDDVNLDNIYLTSRYKFAKSSYTPYLTANLGYSQLSWNKSPINTANNDVTSASYLIGVGAGLLYPISKSSDFILDYTLAYMGHSAKLEPTNSTSANLDHDFLNSISFGFRFNF